MQPDTYAFDDQPAIHEGIWKAASSIANAPIQLAQIRMDQEDRDLAREDRILQMDARKASAARQVAQDKIAADERDIKHENEAKKFRAEQTTKSAAAANKARELDIKERTAADKATAPPKVTTAQNEESRIGLSVGVPRMFAANNPNRGRMQEHYQDNQTDPALLARTGYQDPNTQYTKDVAAMKQNKDTGKAQKKGQYGLSEQQALAAQPKYVETPGYGGLKKAPIPEETRRAQADVQRNASYRPTPGDALRQGLGGSLLPAGNPAYSAAPPFTPEIGERNLPLDVGTPGVPERLGAPLMGVAQTAPVAQTALTPAQRAEQVTRRIDSLPASQGGDIAATMQALSQNDPEVYKLLVEAHGFKVRPAAPTPAPAERDSAYSYRFGM